MKEHVFKLYCLVCATFLRVAACMVTPFMTVVGKVAKVPARKAFLSRCTPSAVFQVASETLNATKAFPSILHGLLGG